ncbi:hypothetical protein S40288_02384 [Stachybotrys chartarum IBT 40288]|nr:hypothetical protein S40288_02384 [Stachybotrys chartarum IBT 40288]
MSSSSEFHRQRDAQTFLQTWQAAQGSSLSVALNVDSIGAPDLRDAKYKPQPSPDRTLNALAQLAVLRLDVKRCMVSLIDTSNQHILAEATRKLHLVAGDAAIASPGIEAEVLNSPKTDHDAELWLGTSVLPREEAVCGHCLTEQCTAPGPNGQLYSAPGLIIPDCRLDDRFKSRPYVVSEPGVRFYAGVPIISRNGHKIGAYSVSDERPRDGLTADEIHFMQGVARTIMEHLEWARDRVDRFKGERIVRGLATFIEDCSSTRDETNIAREQPAGNSGDKSSTTRPPELTVNTSRRPLSRKSSYAPSHASRPSQDIPPGRSATHLKNDGMAKMFHRAAEILRYATLADGAIFFGADATITNRKWSDWKSDDCNPTEEDEEVLSAAADPAGLSSDSDASPVARPCKVLAFAAADGQPHIDMESGPAMSVGTLDRYYTLFPRGKMFSFNDEGVGMFSGEESTSEGDESSGAGSGRTSRSKRRKLRMDHKELLKKIPDAKSVVFVPLFDLAEDRLAAGCFLWTSVPGRLINLDQDLSYLRAFCNSIMSQVGRITTQKNEAAKTTFIASMSHELRSPLHGILGAAEFLKDATTDAYQLGLVNSISTCGKTLLDTLNHVLDYSKINRFGRSQLRKSAKQSKVGNVSSDSLESINMTAKVDLGILVEEVVDAVAAGHIFRMRRGDNVAEPIELMEDKDGNILSADDLAAQSDEGPVSVLLDISPRASWTVKTQPGALRRIIMNLFGNALKYTPSGYIHISLHGQETADDSKIDVLIRVVDSGKGMSEEFQRNRLFVPFSQEDSFQPGTGLGLSIVKQIVDSLTGSLEVKSQQGKGTEFDVRLRLPVANNQAAAQSEENMADICNQMQGLKLVLLERDRRQQTPSTAKQFRKLNQQLNDTCSAWFGMSVRWEGDLSEMVADFYLYCEPPSVESLDRHFRDKKQMHMKARLAPIIIVCLNASEAARISKIQGSELSRFSDVVEIISQPCGPRKLAKVFSRCLRRVEELSLKLDSSTSSRAPGEVETTEHSGSPSERRKDHLTRLESFLHRNQPTDLSQQRGAASVMPQPPPLQTSSVVLPEDVLKKAERQDNRDKASHVLLVDDNKINRQLLVMFMMKCGYTYKEAANGQEAVDRFIETCSPDSETPPPGKKRFDFILMDISMPIMNGVDATRQIREFEQEHELPPTTVVALTGLASEDARRDAISAGVDIFLPKPVRFAELKKLLVTE